jgi:hypothetical protein
VKADSLRLAEVWESEKARLQSEVARQREQVQAERDNAIRVREQTSFLTEEIRADSARVSEQGVFDMALMSFTTHVELFTTHVELGADGLACHPRDKTILRFRNRANGTLRFAFKVPWFRFRFFSGHF